MLFVNGDVKCLSKYETAKRKIYIQISCDSLGEIREKMDIYLTDAFCENYTCVLNRFGKQSQIVRKLIYMGDCTSHTDELLIEIF